MYYNFSLYIAADISAGGYVFTMGNMYSFGFCSCEFNDNLIHAICVSSFADK